MTDAIITTDHELGWEDEISNDGQDFVLLPEGDYNFAVSSFTRGRYAGGGKKITEPCNKAELTISVDGGELGTATVFENLFLHTSAEWKICQFFTAVSERKHGEKIAMDWANVIGAGGRCHVRVREYTDKNGAPQKTNDITKFIDPADYADEVTDANAPTFVAGQL